MSRRQSVLVAAIALAAVAAPAAHRIVAAFAAGRIVAVPTMRRIAAASAAHLMLAALTPPLASAAPPAPPAAASPDPAAIDATTRWSEHRAFRVHYDSNPSPVPLLTVHRWTVAITDPDGKPVTGALVTVLGGMPAHGHGFPTVPTVRELGDGRYLVEGLKFHMPGAWVVAFRIKAGTVVDSVSFALELP